MKKIISFLSILLVGVLCSACVNTFAVHELNKIAIQYLEKGDTKNAISRLESSIDLDDTIWESRYNLAIAYLKENECEKALKNIDEAIKLADKSNIKDSYYTKGIAYDCLADSLSKDDDEDDDSIIKKPKLTDDEIESKTSEYLQLANENYEKYLEGNDSAQDIDEVKAQIQNNLDKINKTASDDDSMEQ